jgi:hypothetical protein
MLLAITIISDITTRTVLARIIKLGRRNGTHAELALPAGRRR